MSVTNLSPNMNLTVPVPGQETGPQWATDLYNALYFTIDGHDHSSGNGAQIVSGSININADLPFNGYNITGPKTLRFQNQSAAISASSPNLSCIYAAPNGGSGVYDLWFNDGAGNQIAITKSGAVTGASGTITGLPSGTASAAFSGSTFTFQSATSTAATLDGRNLTLRNSTASSSGYTLQPPDAMGADYSIKFPVVPGSGTYNLMYMPSSGTIGTSLTVDTTTVAISGGLIGIATGGVGTTQLASSAVTTAKIADANVTRAKLAALGQQVSTRCNFTTTSSTLVDVTNMTVTITSTGRPVMLMIQPAANFEGGIECDGPASMSIAIARDTDGTIAQWGYNGLTNGFNQANILSMLYLDTAATAGAHTYKVRIKNSNGSSTVGLSNAVIVAYEMA